MPTIYAGEFNATATVITPPVFTPQVGDTLETLLAKYLALLLSQFGL